MLKNLRRTRNTFRNIRNPWQYFQYKLAGRKGDFTFRADHGISMTVPKRLLPTFKEMFFRMPYREGMPANFIRNARPTVIDIGANAGFFSFYVLSKFPKAEVWAFEPFPPNHALLSDYASQHPQFKLHPLMQAVAGEAGHLDLAYDPADAFSTSASLQADSAADQHAAGMATVRVETVSLPQAMATHHIDHIDWLKVDCEGAEYQIFASLTADVLAKISAITVETHDSETPGENPEAIVGLLKQHGFQVRTHPVSPLIWAWKS